MEIIENKVIEYFDDERRVIRTERILWISPDKQQVAIINLDNKSSLPEWTRYQSIEEDLSSIKGRILEVDPYSQIVSMEEPSKKNLQSRDKAWALIHDFVMEEPDIYDPRLRGAMINEFIASMEAKNVKVHKTQIYRKLRQYWLGGKTKTALLCDFRNCGGPGESRVSKTD